MKRVSLALLAFVLSGCPNPETGKVDPWLTAKTIINQSRLGVPIADTIFLQWELSQADEEKVARAKATYSKVKLAVLDGLQVAYDGVVLAEQAKTDPDMAKLMDKAEKAWASLRTFIEGLMKTEEPATTQPTPKARSKPAFEMKEIDLSKLPKTLLPKR